MDGRRVGRRSTSSSAAESAAAGEARGGRNRRGTIASFFINNSNDDEVADPPESNSSPADEGEGEGNHEDTNDVEDIAHDGAHYHTDDGAADDNVSGDDNEVPTYEDFYYESEEEEGEGDGCNGVDYPTENHVVQELQHPDVVATLDFNEEDEEDSIDGVDIGDGLFSASKHDAPSGIQQKLVWAVFISECI